MKPFYEVTIKSEFLANRGYAFMRTHGINVGDKLNFEFTSYDVTFKTWYMEFKRQSHRTGFPHFGLYLYQDELFSDYFYDSNGGRDILEIEDYMQALLVDSIVSKYSVGMKLRNSKKLTGIVNETIPVGCRWIVERVNGHQVFIAGDFIDSIHGTIKWGTYASVIDSDFNIIDDITMNPTLKNCPISIQIREW